MSGALSPSLDDLAASANGHHAKVMEGHTAAVRAMSVCLRHAVSAGEALNSARELVPHGEWLTWCDANVTIARDTIHKYCRIAHYRAEVEEWMRNGGSGDIFAAWSQLKGLPPVGGGFKYTEERRQEVIELSIEGKSVTAISEHTGVALATIRKWLDPERARVNKIRSERKKREQERRASQEQEAAVVALAGLDDGYEAARAAVAALEGTLADEPEANRRLVLALRAARKAEREVVRAAMVIVPDHGLPEDRRLKEAS